eukprot:scaffold16011_cov126-Isochrysis_galbana.AAC.7
MQASLRRRGAALSALHRSSRIMGKGGDGAVRLATRKVDATESLNVHLYGKAVDVSKFAQTHPGGAKALRIFDNRDATEQFEMYHSPAGAPARDQQPLAAPAWSRAGRH